MFRTAQRWTACVACFVATMMASGKVPAEAPDNAESAKGVTFCKQVARILQKRCQECHRPGEIGPFSLLNYENARDWSDTIKEVVQERRMPPWFADHAVGKFSNDRSLSPDEIDTLSNWIDAGMPKGDPRDLPEPRKFPEGWRIGKPDVVLSMSEEFQVPATGVVRYHYSTIPTNFDEDKWVQAVQLKAGSPAVVHHILMMVRPPEWKFGDGPPRSASSDDQALGFFAALAPGNPPRSFPPGFGKRIPKGWQIVLQMHYTPNGTPQTDRSSVALIFAKEPVHTEVRTRGIYNNNFSIPPGADNFEVRSAFRTPQDVIVLSLMPHMHLRGKSFEYTVEYPDGQRVPLLRVPRYDFNWQLNYDLAEPLRLPKGARVNCVAHFDNSPANKANPDPTQRITWGDQTWNEMMIGYINYYIPTERATAERAGGGGE